MIEIVTRMSELASKVVPIASHRRDPKIIEELNNLLTNPALEFPEYHAELMDYDPTDAYEFWKPWLEESVGNNGTMVLTYIKRIYGKQI